MLRSKILPSSAIAWAVKTVLVSYAPQRFCAQVTRAAVADNDSEVLDRFIDTLMTNKVIKWRLRNEAYCKSDKEVSTSDMPHVSLAETSFECTRYSVDDYVCNHLTSPDLDSVLNDCREKEISPSPETLMKAAYVLARTGNITGIDTIISLADISIDFEEKRKDEFKVIQAEALWRGGKSIQKSLEILHEVYKNNPHLRRYVRSSLKSLIGEVIENRGEASLVQVKKLVLELACPPYEDARPLSYLWGHCILSEWFADQQISVEIVTLGKDNPKFKRALQNRLDAVVGQALTGHQVEAIYRVIEALLRLAMYKPAQSVLGKLFDYKYIMGDKKGCGAILELCAISDLDVGYTRRKQFENAQVGREKRRNTRIAPKNSEKLQDSTEVLPVPKFKLKL